MSCTGAAVSVDQSKNIYIDNTVRGLLSWWGVSALPLWQVWELVVDRFFEQTIPYLGPGWRFFSDRLTALNALTKTQLGELLDDEWDEVVNTANFTKNELIEKVLAYEGMWVDLGYPNV